MDGMMIDPKIKEAESVEEQMHDAARLMGQAIRNEDVASKKALQNALQNAAKVLIDTAMKRFDELPECLLTENRLQTLLHPHRKYDTSPY